MLMILQQSYHTVVFPLLIPILARKSTTFWQIPSKPDTNVISSRSLSLLVDLPPDDSSNCSSHCSHYQDSYQSLVTSLIKVVVAYWPPAPLWSVHSRARGISLVHKSYTSIFPKSNHRRIPLVYRITLKSFSLAHRAFRDLDPFLTMYFPNSLYPSVIGTSIASAVYVALSSRYTQLIIHAQLSHFFLCGNSLTPKWVRCPFGPFSTQHFTLS